MPSSTQKQREDAQADADEAATSDTAEVTTTTVVPSTVAAEKAAEAKGTDKAAQKDDEKPARKDPPICVECYRGVWPGDAVRVSCEHGQFERPDPADHS